MSFLTWLTRKKKKASNDRPILEENQHYSLPALQMARSTFIEGGLTPYGSLGQPLLHNYKKWPGRPPR